MEDYWKHASGVSVEEARIIAKGHGFGMEIGRVSRFDNARGVVLGKADLRGDLVNKILLAEEIQHGLDRTSGEASRSVRRGLTNEEFHAEVFERILSNFDQGKFQFLTEQELQAIRLLIASLLRQKA